MKKIKMDAHLMNDEQMSSIRGGAEKADFCPDTIQATCSNGVKAECSGCVRGYYRDSQGSIVGVICDGVQYPCTEKDSAAVDTISGWNCSGIEHDLSREETACCKKFPNKYCEYYDIYNEKRSGLCEFRDNRRRMYCKD